MTESRSCLLTAEEMVRLAGQGEITRREFVEAHLERIAAHNGAINAIVETRGEAALAEAAAADPRCGQSDGTSAGRGSDQHQGPLRRCRHETHRGVHAMAHRVSTTDEVAVARLRAAGAIVVGKCNQPDFQIRWNTVSDLYGATRNPRDLKRTAGGSSGGDAAAVASGMAAFGLGADYGGSIRVPASFCGIYGLRPSAGRVPAVATLPPFDGPPTLDLMASIGPFARSVSDLWRAFEVLSGADPRDPATIDLPLRTGSRGTGRRVVRMCHQTGAAVAQEIAAALDQTAYILSRAGYEIVAGLPPAFVLTAGCDPLHDEGVACGEKLRQAGVPVQHRDYPDQIHVFWSFGALSEASRTKSAYSARPTSANFGMMSLHSIPTESRQPCQSST